MIRIALNLTVTVACSAAILAGLLSLTTQQSIADWNAKTLSNAQRIRHTQRAHHQTQMATLRQCKTQFHHCYQQAERLVIQHNAPQDLSRLIRWAHQQSATAIEIQNKKGALYATIDL